MTLTTSPAATAQVGDAIPPLTVQPTALQLFRYSAVTWNAHKIHFDPEYAAAEGHPGILVHSHLHAAFLARACTQWAGPLALRSMAYRIVRPATPADRLTVTGTVTAREIDGDEIRLVVELVESAADGQPRATGTATVGVPAADGGGR
ncbi:MaoC/PaaZ C-terminal domain-containing protein [Blastococcus sp. SYSU DS0616]